MSAERSFAVDQGNSFPTAANAETARRTVAALMPGQRLRESCDFCTKRKRKCDGDGVNRCSFCVAKNQPECHFSVRRATGPRPDSASRRVSKGLSGKAAKATAPSAGGLDASGGGGGGLVSARRGSKTLPMKRARLSPSPATGLIGLRENVYIAEYFRTIGFVPFTNESFVRKAMVKTMFGVVRQKHEAGLSGCPAAFWKVEEDGEEEGESGDGAVVPRLGSRDAIENAADACVLWCTVAVGCLVGGRPKSSVEGYALLAREALSDCFDDGSVQTARAFTAMALLQDVMGNEEKFSKYIDFSRSILRALPAAEVPRDLMDADMFVTTCDMYDGFYDQLGEDDFKDAIGAASGKAEEARPIQLAELRRWMLKTDVRSSACFSMDMQNKGFFDDLTKDNTQEDPCSGPGPSSGSGSGPAAGPGGDGSGDLASNSPPHAAYDEAPGTRPGLDTPGPRLCWRRPLSGSLPGPPPPRPMCEKFAAQILPEVKLMLHATKSPEIRGGVGEVKLQSIMAYACVLQGQLDNAVSALARCTEIFVKNPGMSRVASWRHVVHCCLAVMVISGNVEKYEELRAAHNSVVDSDFLRPPPFEEFRGMSSICGNIFCKFVGKIFVEVAARERDDPYLHDGAPSTSEGNTKPSPPTTIASQGVGTGTAPFSSAVSDESRARGVSDKHGQPADMEGGSGRDQQVRGTRVSGNGSCDDIGGLELLHASELEDAEAAGLLDAVDELLGEVLQGGCAEGGSEEDALPSSAGSA